MTKTVLSIDGRKCPECEAHVNRLLLDHIKEAVDVKSSARKNTSIICSDNKINKEEAREHSVVLDTSYLESPTKKESRNLFLIV